MYIILTQRAWDDCSNLSPITATTNGKILTVCLKERQGIIPSVVVVGYRQASAMPLHSKALTQHFKSRRIISVEGVMFGPHDSGNKLRKTKPRTSPPIALLC
jgi:hypothetical protein